MNYIKFFERLDIVLITPLIRPRYKRRMPVDTVVRINTRRPCNTLFHLQEIITKMNLEG